MNLYSLKQTIIVNNSQLSTLYSTPLITINTQLQKLQSNTLPTPIHGNPLLTKGVSSPTFLEPTVTSRDSLRTDIVWTLIITAKPTANNQKYKNQNKNNNCCNKHENNNPQ